MLISLSQSQEAAAAAANCQPHVGTAAAALPHWLLLLLCS